MSRHVCLYTYMYKLCMYSMYYNHKYLILNNLHGVANSIIYTNIKLKNCLF